MGNWLDKYKDGGVIKDDRGQWEHPGEITEINSNNITMRGVSYPVLGISDTGDRQMMFPGQDYQYEGSKVTEYPMAQDGIKIDGVSGADYGKTKRETPIIPVISNNGKYRNKDSEAYKNLKPLKTANTWTNMLGNVGKYFFDIDDSNLIRSNYKPSISNDSSSQYYTREGMKEDVFSDLISSKVQKDYNHNETFNDIYSGLKNNGKDRKHSASNSFPLNKVGYKGMYNLGNPSKVNKAQFNLGRYTVDAGEDNKGKYISFFDVYDWNGFKLENSKPIQFYDRLYEKDWKDMGGLLSYKNGGELQKLDQLTNFTNYNKPQPGGWLNKY